MKRLIIAAALILSSAAVHAATVTVTGTNPSQNTDNSAIPATGAGSLTSLRIEYGTCNGVLFGTRLGEVTRTAGAPGANFSHTINLDPGTSCVRVFALNTYGKESAASNVVSRVVDPPTPKPPVLVEAVIAGMNFSPVYRLTQAGKRDARYSDACGFIPVGKECQGPVVYRFRGEGLRRVALADVKPYGNVSCGDFAVAPCG